ncbi:MAG: CocE/NonD family hydrolase, partial [Frankia sp.]
MTLTSRLARRILNLPAADHPRVAVERDLPVSMRDGQILLADRYFPQPGNEQATGGTKPAPPVVLIRCPYGRGGLYGLLFGRLLAERGFAAVIQSTRGTFGSGGVFEPFREREDGADTVAWITGQPWFTGVLGTTGISYLGLTQWALAADAGPTLVACVITASASQFRDQTYPGGGFGLANGLTWANLISSQEKRGGLARMAAGRRRVNDSLGVLPLADLDRRTTGHRVAFWQDWLAHARPGDPYWDDRRFDGTLGEVTAQVTLVGGWYDIFLPWLVRDYVALRAAGRHP